MVLMICEALLTAKDKIGFTNPEVPLGNLHAELRSVTMLFYQV